MAMTIESILKVSDEESYRLLMEPEFDCVGQLAELLDTEELRHRRVPNTAGVLGTDIIRDIVSTPRSIAHMTGILRRGCEFALANPSDSRLIYTCIDHFIMAQSRLLPKRIGGVKSEHLDDIHELSELNTYLLKYCQLADNIDNMNKPVAKEIDYKSIFNFSVPMVSDNLTMTDAIRDSEIEGEVEKLGAYQSPFSGLVKHRSVNRINRF